MADPATTNANGNGAAPTHGFLAEFPDIPTLYAAAHKLREHGFSKWDVYSPVPIHDMPEAMGLKPSKITYIMGFGAITGVVSAVVLTGWTSAGFSIDPEWLSGYQIVTAGKPLFAWEQFMPIYFELGVLVASLCAFAGMFALNRLPMLFHPLQTCERFLRASDDGLFVAIESDDPKFDERETPELLRELGATAVEAVRE